MKGLISDAGERSRIWDALASVAVKLFSDEASHPSLLRGLSGDVLCGWYLRKLDGDLVAADRLDEAVERLQNSAETVQGHPDMSDGITGMAWLFELLLAEQDDPYIPGFNRTVDQFLTRLVAEDCWNGELEYVMGLSGIGAYAARRWRQSGDQSLYRQVIEAYERNAEWQGNLCTWATPAKSVFQLDTGDPETTEGVQYNLGLAHGVPGMIAALLPAVDSPELGAKARPLVIGACDWLRLQAQDPAYHGSYFSTLANVPGKSRLGWCYGDLPIALTLLRVGKQLNRRDYVDFAHRVAEHAAGRDAEDGIVWDAGLCHGGAGLCLMFLLLDRLEPRAVYRKAAEYWFRDVMARYERDGVAGFDAFRTDEETMEHYQEPATGFLSGYGGVALCLTVAAGLEPDWVDGILIG